MPAGNGTGPKGMGPMTGRAAGFCVGYANPMAGRGMGFGQGCGFGAAGGNGRAMGRGWRHMFWATGLPGWTRSGMPAEVSNREQERDQLKAHVERLESHLLDIRARIQNLELEEKPTPV